MVPDIDPPPDYELIANRKGKRATDEEKEEIYRLMEAGVKLAKVMEITQRSEDSIRRYVREVDAAVNSAMRTQAAAYQNLTSPQPPPPPPTRPAVDEDGMIEDSPPASSRPLPPLPEPPEVELDLDDLFDEDELVDPTEEDALPKKLFVLLLQKKAVKEEDDARDIAQDYRMYPDYHNPHGTVEFLKGHDIKERKANLISRLLFGWQHQSQGRTPFDPGPVPGWHPGMPTPSPGSPGYNPFQQQWGGHPGYGAPGQPTMPGQYPFPWPQPPPPQPAGDSKITKKDIQDLVSKAVSERDTYWMDYMEKQEAKREKDLDKAERRAELDELRAQNQRLENKMHEMETNPQTAPPDGNYETIEEPEHDEEGNLIRVKVTHRKLEDPVRKEIDAKYDTLLKEIKEERKEHKAELAAILEQKNNLEIEKLKVENEG